MGKRIFDLAVSIIGLIALAPWLGLTAVAVKMTSKGPVLFRQQRLGRYGKPFTMYKFRSMVADAPQKGAAVTAGGDVRITPLGRLLRRTKLDELPQLWNVARGDMSFVGPRPEVPEFAGMFPHEYARILAVRPGITHRGTLAFRKEEVILGQVHDARRFYIDRVMPHKLELYERYLDQSLLKDVLTIIETVTPLKMTPAVAVGDLLDAPLVANIPLYDERPAHAAAAGGRTVRTFARTVEPERVAVQAGT